MAEAIPANPGMALVPAQPQSLIGTLTDPAGGTPMERARGFLAQGPVKKALPWFAGMAVLGGAAVAWSTLAPAPQRVLYAQLDDAERASVVGALDKGNIHYRIDSSTGALTVDEGDLYKARMLVAQNGALSLPDTANDSLDKLPMGASRALEGERLRAAREHELMLSIKEIDGVQAVRVHLAEGEKSVFVRDQIAPSASVMLRWPMAPAFGKSGFGHRQSGRRLGAGADARRREGRRSARPSALAEGQRRPIAWTCRPHGREAARPGRHAADPDAGRRQFHQRDPGRSRHGSGHLGPRKL
jgi:hypothetical protein